MRSTPVSALSPELICQYSNSAHELPKNSAELTAFLPRYLELIAQGIRVDYVEVGTELRRFGIAQAAKPPLPEVAQCDLMDRWARLMLRHVGCRKPGSYPERIETLIGLAETLLVGGAPLNAVTTALEDLFADPGFGRAALLVFLQQIGLCLRHDTLACRALVANRPGLAAPFADWLNSILAAKRSLEIARDPALPDDLRPDVQRAVDRASTITPERIG
ncbi:hypothetical protein HOY34_00350 [Xinfangfangia sp. D13-10-4-6]|uniref:hypothetical protein n=1 Tax=Pseudogemmobacter hezensis TaxID=2737662 RepID=UPI001554B448|nr:hypothetical protein [Pseudogemmobacter hezensis]NPD13649.1 hypothetical protein [Pseudogemmobacter hezensis]